MQIGEQHLIGPHPGVFLGDRFLDLEQQLTAPPDVVRGVEELRAGGQEILVGQ